MFTLSFFKQFPTPKKKNGAKSAAGEKEASFPYYTTRLAALGLGVQILDLQ